MKLLILGDLHIEFGPFEPPQTDADVVILAGDTHVSVKGVEWAIKAFEGLPVIYIAGNHEYYHQSASELIGALQSAAAGTNVHVLENEGVTIGEVTFLGCTLWTDFSLYGDHKVDQCAYHAQRCMTDFSVIRSCPGGDRIGPLHMIAWHERSLSWLKAQATAASGKKVVITHHAPSLLSVPKRDKNDPASATYATELSGWIENSGIDLWVHGHTHDSFDYHIGETRIVCNPRGYMRGEKNRAFDADLTVDL